MEKTVNHPAPNSEANSAIQFRLADFHIGFLSPSPLINQYARHFLADWQTSKGKPTATTNDIQIQLELVDQLPNLPNKSALYQGDRQHLKDGIGTLSVYQQTNGYLLNFLNGGQVKITADHDLIRGHITVELLKHGRLYDLIFTSLSYFLRRQGYYLIHASAAVNEGTATIFVGPPGCAKSTTVLNLALNGWGVLSNDTLLLEKRPNGIYALPAPGGFSIRPQSINHIPALAAYIPQPLPGDFYHLSLSKLGSSWAEPAPIKTIYFPELNNGRTNKLQPLPPAIALAHLIELSLDRWDKTAFPAHLTFLEQLSRQAQAATLSIANQSQLPDLLTNQA